MGRYLVNATGLETLQEYLARGKVSSAEKKTKKTCSFVL